jgi:septal ring factor EnvC (AmiA/AmiB activator)
MHNLDSQTVQLLIVAAVAVTMLLQAIALLAIFNTLRKAADSMREDIEQLRTTVLPVLENVRDLLVKNGPKIEAATTDFAAMSHNLCRQTADIQVAGREIFERLQKQSQRVDAMLTKVLDAVDRTGGFMTDTVTKPMRQISGLLASAKAVIESLRSDPSTHAVGEKARGDKDMFV